MLIGIQNDLKVFMWCEIFLFISITTITGQTISYKKNFAYIAIFFFITIIVLFELSVFNTRPMAHQLFEHS